MIGQIDLRNRMKSLIESDMFPRFSILVGPWGSGKKMFAAEIIDMFNSRGNTFDFVHSYQIPDVKIDTIRQLITQSYKAMTRVIYIIPDADSMSTAAKNALLKITEEPPNNAYFIMTLEDENNMLDTIKSRGTIFYMDRYSSRQILEYSVDLFGIDRLDNSTRGIICDLCDTPGDVNILNKCGLYEFYDYVQLVLNNIADVSLANSFKIPSKIALKDDGEGYDLKLFWKAFIQLCMKNSFIEYDEKTISDRVKQYMYGIKITSKYLKKLNTRGINKQMLIDNWLLDIRETWNNE